MVKKGGSHMKESISLKLPAKSEYVSIARLTASVVANNMGFDMESIEDIKVAVGEACNNAILHGKCESIFEILFLVQGSHFVVEVLDCGCGFVVDSYDEPDLSHPKEGGLGIFIMKTLMDEVNVHSHLGEGTKIRMTKRLII